MSFSYKSLFRFQICGHSIRIAKSSLDGRFYVQKFINRYWRNLHKIGFDSFQVALDYTIQRSVSTIKSSAYAGTVK